jgi:hypothetical protein
VSFILQPDKPFEDDLLLSLRDPYSIIFDRDEKIQIPANGNINPTPTIFHGIADEVTKNLLDLLLIMAEGRLAILSSDRYEDSIGLKQASKLLLIFSTTELFRYLG